jgi:hypothetical protein
MQTDLVVFLSLEKLYMSTLESECFKTNKYYKEKLLISIKGAEPNCITFLCLLILV